MGNNTSTQISIDIMRVYSTCNGDRYCVLRELYKLEKEKQIILYAGTYSFSKAIDLFDYDTATFYFYEVKSKAGYVFYGNRMGACLRKDDRIFKFSHRYLYNKGHLSNCFFGESDFRSGEFFKKRRIQIPFL